jgi:hypothetical protein
MDEIRRIPKQDDEIENLWFYKDATPSQVQDIPDLFQIDALSSSGIPLPLLSSWKGLR